MIDYLTHYYNIDNGPFQSLSALPDAEAIRIMQRLCDDTPYGLRFKDPIQYLQDRKATEQWVREAFIAKGGKPKDRFPIPMVLGSSKWLVEVSPNPEKHGRNPYSPLAAGGRRCKLHLSRQHDFSLVWSRETRGILPGGAPWARLHPSRNPSAGRAKGHARRSMAASPPQSLSSIYRSAGLESCTPRGLLDTNTTLAANNRSTLTPESSPRDDNCNCQLV